MIEIKMVCNKCEYDFGGVENAFHYCYDGVDSNGEDRFIESDEITTKNIIFKEEINKYILKSWSKNES